MRITINDASGLANAMQAMAALRRRGERTLPLMQVIAQDLENSTKLRFKDGRDPNGVPWAPITLAAKLSRARRLASKSGQTLRTMNVAKLRAFLGPAQPLLDTRVLANSITSRATNTYAEVGTNKNYAPTHQFGARQGQYGRSKRGGPVPWGNVPARPFIGLSNEDRALIAERVADFLTAPR